MNIINQLKKKYGEPAIENIDFNLSSGSRTLCIWLIGQYVDVSGEKKLSDNGVKNISFEIIRASNGYSYKWYLYIRNHHFPVTKYEPTEAEKAKIEAEKKEEQAKENYKNNMSL